MENHKESETAGKVIRCKGCSKKFRITCLCEQLIVHVNLSNHSVPVLSVAQAAAICRKPREPLVIEEIEVDPPKAWEVRIKILCTSLCHSDLTFWKMNPVKQAQLTPFIQKTNHTAPHQFFKLTNSNDFDLLLIFLLQGPVSVFPRIFGHEAVGVVESVGENVEGVEEGDLVLPVFAANCEECRDCKSSKSNMCAQFKTAEFLDMPRDGTSRFRDMKGEVVHHFLSVSSFTEYTVVDVAHLVKISPGIPVDKACLLSCGVSTGIGAAWKVADVEEGSTVAIFGLGAVGLAVAEGARIRRASKIIGIDLNPDKIEMAKGFGVTDFINPTTCVDKPVSEVIKAMTDGGADYCFECIGLASVMQLAFSSSRKGWGKTVVLGLEMHGSPLSLNCSDMLNGRSLSGSLFGGIKPKYDIPLIANKYLDKELCLDKFITHEVSFHDINKAFDLLVEGKSLRCMIWMDK